eukprot:scaffold7040_cov256-Pinguiococcus_pyrenoidosus.AAC.10
MKLRVNRIPASGAAISNALRDLCGASTQSRSLALHRRTPRLGAGHIHAQVLQGRHQVLDGSLPHPRRAVQDEVAIARGHHRAQRPHGRPGIAQEQLGDAFAALESAAQALHGDLPGLLVLFQLHSEALERAEHVADVVGVQQVLHHGPPLGQGGQKQHSVAQALAAGQGDGAGDGGNGLQVQLLGAFHTCDHVQVVPASQGASRGEGGDP